MPETTDAAGLLERHRVLAYVLAKKYHRRVRHLISRDELNGAALVGLWRAARTFDAGRGVRFTTHAWRNIRGEMCDWLRKIDPATRGQRRGGCFPEHVRWTAAAAECVGADCDDFRLVDLRDAVRELRRRLSWRLRLLLRLRCDEGFSVNECAAVLGVAPQVASALLAQIGRVLRRLFPE